MCLVHELEELVDDRLEELPVCLQETRILADDIHNIGGNDCFVILATLDLAKAKKVVLYPFQNRRWDSDFLALKKLLELPADHPKSLGTLFEFESRYAQGMFPLGN